MGGQQRLAVSGALAIVLAEPVANHQPHAFIGGLARQVEELRVGTQAFLAVNPDLLEVPGIGIRQRVAPTHVPEGATLGRPVQRRERMRSHAGWWVGSVTGRPNERPSRASPVGSVTGCPKGRRSGSSLVGSVTGRLNRPSS